MCSKAVVNRVSVCMWPLPNDIGGQADKKQQNLSQECQIFALTSKSNIYKCLLLQNIDNTRLIYYNDQLKNPASHFVEICNKI